MGNNSLNGVKDVAIYLRKSRGEEDDLDKHRADLVELCEKYNWRYVEYAEIGSSQKLEERPELAKLLKDINEGMYDAVLVMDKDRLSREGVGQAQVNKTLIDNDCLIITHAERVYDLSDDSDIMMSEVEDLVARFEYRTIVKRLMRGKKRGSKQGHWTNGTPPIPYVYNPNTKGLDIDEKKLEIYRYIVDSFLSGHAPYSIAWELNRLNIPSPRGSIWQPTTVKRILLDETHLGKIIANKTSGTKKRLSNGRLDYTVNKKEDWIIVENCHTKAKSFEEHDKILIEFKKRKRASYAASGEVPLSGLIICGKCGSTMSQKKGKIADKNYSYVNICKNYYEDSEDLKCNNLGGSTELLIEEIEKQLMLFKDDIEKEQRRVSENGGLLKTLTLEKKKREEAIIELEGKLDQVTELALTKFFTPEEAVIQKKKILDKISKAEDELHALNVQTNNLGKMSDSERINTINSVLEVIRDPRTSKRNLNRAYKSIINSIIWNKPSEDALTVTVNFL